MTSSTSLSLANPPFLQSAPAVGTAWVVSSAILTTYSTTRFLKYESESPSTSQIPWLGRLSRPTLLVLFRFGGSLLLGLLLHPDWQIPKRITQTLADAPYFLLPAVFLFVANLTNSISLDRIGISLTYTSKCGIPLMTVLLTLLLDGRASLPPALALWSLLPIAVGIAAASWSAPTFEMVGFLAALLSTMSQSALNVTSKRVMLKSGVNGPAAQRAMVAVGLLLTSIMTLLQPLWERNQATAKPLKSLPPTWLSILALVAYHIEYVLSFMFVKLVHPVTYGTLDAVRRLTIILTGRAFFTGDRLTRVNRMGIALALMGALSYSVACNV